MHSDFADDGWREPITENVDIYTVAEPLESVSWYWWEGEYYPGARLTTSLGRDERATWSSDGTRILFVSDRDGNPEIYAMNADGSGQTNLTNEPAMDAVTSLMN
jgi:Tol biopolymer transport system component